MFEIEINREKEGRSSERRTYTNAMDIQGKKKSIMNRRPMLEAFEGHQHATSAPAFCRSANPAGQFSIDQQSLRIEISRMTEYRGV